MGATTDLLITEVGQSYYASVPTWVEVFNGTPTSVNLSGYSLRAYSVLATGSTWADEVFALPSLTLPSGGYALIKGGTGSALPGPSVAVVTGATGRVPFWGVNGHVELLRNGQTIDFVRFGSDSTPSTTASGWSGASADGMPANSQYSSALVRSLSNLDTHTSADWSVVEYATGGGPNDVLPGAVDLDDDGIPDSAEVPGGTFAGVDVYSMGARTGARDIFIEVDAMASTDPAVTPRIEAIDKVAQVLGNRGFVLHVDAGDLFSAHFNPPRYNLGQTDSTVPPALCVGFPGVVAGCVGSIYQVKAEHFDLSRMNIFHYVLFGTSQAADGSCGTGGGAELHGNDVVVSLGGCGHAATPGTALNLLLSSQAAVLLHELGHNLNLDHGGADGINYKPNYLSIMNHMYAYSGVPDPTSGRAADLYKSYKGWYSGNACTLEHSPCGDLSLVRLDFSDGTGAPIDESSANETAGLGRAGATPVDFDNDGVLGLPAFDVNGDGQRTHLLDSNDWARLSPPFQRSSAWSSAPTPEGPRFRRRARFDPVADDRQPLADERGLTWRARW